MEPDLEMASRDTDFAPTVPLSQTTSAIDFQATVEKTESQRTSHDHNRIDVDSAGDNNAHSFQAKLDDFYISSAKERLSRQVFKHAFGTPEFLVEVSPGTMAAELYPEGDTPDSLASTAFDEPGRLALAVQRSHGLLVSYFCESLVAQMAAIKRTGTTDEQSLMQLLTTRQNLDRALSLPFGDQGEALREICERDQVTLFLQRAPDQSLIFEPVSAEDSPESRDYFLPMKTLEARQRSPSISNCSLVAVPLPPRKKYTPPTFMQAVRRIPQIGTSRGWRQYMSKGAQRGKITMMERKEYDLMIARLPRRLFSAALSAVSLLVPMLIMVINPSYLKTLITGSAAIALFALMLAFFPISNMEVVSGVGAYAAVQVVFIALVVPAA